MLASRGGCPASCLDLSVLQNQFIILEYFHEVILRDDHVTVRWGSGRDLGSEADIC